MADRNRPPRRGAHRHHLITPPKLRLSDLPSLHDHHHFTTPLLLSSPSLISSNLLPSPPALPCRFFSSSFKEPDLGTLPGPLRAGMEPRKTPPEYFLEIFADTTTVRDVLKGVLNLIFFHRYFPSIRPVTFDVLDFTLPAINDADLETLIESRVSALVRQHLSSAAGTQDGKAGGGGGVRGRIAVEFYEKKRRRSGMWFGGLAGKGEEEVCWEIWTLDVTIATPRTESERAKVRKAMGNMLQKAALKILNVVNKDKDHIPPITTSESNPFPYRIVVNPRTDGWGNRMGLY